MMQFETIPNLVRMYKGCAWAVLSLLMAARQPMSAEWLERNSGYSDKIVHKALLTLEEDRRITRNGRYAWQIAAGVMQLPFMTPELDSEAPEPAGEAVDNPVDNPVPLRECEAQDAQIEAPEPLFRGAKRGLPFGSAKRGTRRNSESEIPGPLASSRSTILDLKQENLLPASNPDPEKFRVASNLAELDAHGIREPARTKLARLAHVTPELIRAHCQACRNPGQAIYRIQNDWPIEIPVIPESVITGIAVSDDPPVDDQAESWWATITERLREQVPKAIFESYFPFEAPARRTGADLQVLVANHSFEAYVDSTDLSRLAAETSGGAARSVQFVTCWEQP